LSGPVTESNGLRERIARRSLHAGSPTQRSARRSISAHRKLLASGASFARRLHDALRVQERRKGAHARITAQKWRLRSLSKAMAGMVCAPTGERRARHVHEENARNFRNFPEAPRTDSTPWRVPEGGRHDATKLSNARARSLQSGTRRAFDRWCGSRYRATVRQPICRPWYAGAFRESRVARCRPESCQLERQLGRRAGRRLAIWSGRSLSPSVSLRERTTARSMTFRARARSPASVVHQPLERSARRVKARSAVLGAVEPRKWSTSKRDVPRGGSAARRR